MICEIKHYDNDPKPYAMWVDGEFIGSYSTIMEAVSYYEGLLRKERRKENESSPCV